MGSVIMLGAGPLQVPAIQAAKDLGFRVTCLDYDPTAPGFALCDGHALVSTVDEAAVLEFAEEAGPDFVITSTSDAPVRTAAYVSERLGLPCGISYEDAVCATQKDAMRARLAAHGVPMPRFAVCESSGDLVDAARSFGGELIVKPADSSASRGVLLVSSDDATGQLESAFAGARSYSRKGSVMLEERVTGSEVSVECMTVGGKTSVIAVTDKLVTEPPYFVELGHSEPSALPRESLDEAKRVAVATVEAIGIIDGPSHTEIMVTDSGPVVIETAARLGGDLITSKLVPLSTGVDMVGASVRLALGLSADIVPKFRRAAAIRFATAPQAGVLSSVFINPSIMGIDELEEAELYRHAGDVVGMPHSSNDRIGHVVCTGADVAEAIASAERALRFVAFELDGCQVCRGTAGLEGASTTASASGPGNGDGGNVQRRSGQRRQDRA